MVSTMKGDFLWEKIVVEKYILKKVLESSWRQLKLVFCGVFILRLREISGFREKKSYRK